MMIGNKSNKSKLYLSGFGNKFGICCLLVLLLLNPFHSILTIEFKYYRELFAGLFALLLLIKIDSTRYESDKLLRMRLEVFFVALFPLLLVFFALIDTGKDLYQADILLASITLETVSPSLYVLRNAFLYIPMVLYFAVRGLTESEIRLIAATTIIVAPFSVYMFLVSSNIATLQTLGQVAETGGFGLSYNSYVPYLTFPVVSGMYLLTSKSRWLMKGFSFATILTLSIYIVLSASRQSSFFVLICAFMFFYYNKNISTLNKLGMVILLIAGAIIVSSWIMDGYELHDKIRTRYSGVSGFFSDDGGRGNIVKQGLSLLEPIEYIAGAGLTSVIYSGPHNDYIRWMQRIGVFSMIIGFLPFFIAAYKAGKSMWVTKHNTLCKYIFLVLFFTLYHSLFGYPREDAYQAAYCFLGLAIFLGFQRVKRNNRYNGMAISREKGALTG